MWNMWNCRAFGWNEVEFGGNSGNHEIHEIHETEREAGWTHFEPLGNREKPLANRYKPLGNRYKPVENRFEPLGNRLYVLAVEGWNRLEAVFGWKNCFWAGFGPEKETTENGHGHKRS
jgi:hypothetical protein